MSRYDFRPLTEQQKKLNNPAVKNAIRVLKSRGVTLKQIEEVYAYYDRLSARQAGESK